MVSIDFEPFLGTANLLNLRNHPLYLNIHFIYLNLPKNVFINFALFGAAESAIEAPVLTIDG